ncbi:hypothetical protein B0H19DRAFT_1059289 [Mycena capillaripes]|nr:hypothetical protein B0H19DRAFT_1059289 [Mycena capillaripes]
MFHNRKSKQAEIARDFRICLSSIEKFLARYRKESQGLHVPTLHVFSSIVQAMTVDTDNDEWESRRKGKGPVWVQFNDYNGTGSRISMSFVGRLIAGVALRRYREMYAIQSNKKTAYCNAKLAPSRKEEGKRPEEEYADGSVHSAWPV